MNRRELLKALGIGIPGMARAQQAFHAASLATLVFQTTKTTGFSPSFSKTGATLYWKWPDGTYTSSNAPSKNLAAGTKTVSVQSRDGFNKVDQFNGTSQQFSGALPSFAAFTALTDFRCSGNAFTGALPSFAACTALVGFQCYSNSFSGALPSFAACTALVGFYCYSNNFTGALPSFATCTALSDFRCYTNGFSGALPSFAACTALVNFDCHGNAFSDSPAGSFATQKSLAATSFRANALPAAAVNQLLADFVASLGGGRVVCTVNLSGGTNAAPTGQGILDKATLIAAGWTVTTT